MPPFDKTDAQARAEISLAAERARLESRPNQPPPGAVAVAAISLLVDEIARRDGCGLINAATKVGEQIGRLTKRLEDDVFRMVEFEASSKADTVGFAWNEIEREWNR